MRSLFVLRILFPLHSQVTASASSRGLSLSSALSVHVTGVSNSGQLQVHLPCLKTRFTRSTVRSSLTDAMYVVGWWDIGEQFRGCSQLLLFWWHHLFMFCVLSEEEGYLNKPTEQPYRHQEEIMSQITINQHQFFPFALRVLTMYLPLMSSRRGLCSLLLE